VKATRTASPTTIWAAIEAGEPPATWVPETAARTIRAAVSVSTVAPTAVATPRSAASPAPRAVG
jgi:hypothetical protein